MYSENGDKFKRTTSQNSAMHKYFTMLAESLDNAGLDVMATLSEKIAIPWTPPLIKELVWRKVQLAMYPDIESTAKLNTEQVGKIYEVINRHMAQTHGVSVIFPTKERK